MIIKGNMDRFVKFLILLVLIIGAFLVQRQVSEEIAYRTSFNKIGDDIIYKFADFLVSRYDIICFDFSSNLVTSEDSKMLREDNWEEHIPHITVHGAAFLKAIDDRVKNNPKKYIAITTRNNNGRGVERVLEHHVGIKPLILYGRADSALQADHIPENIEFRRSASQHGIEENRVFIGEYTKKNMLLHLSSWYSAKHGTSPRMVMFDDVLAQVWSCYDAGMNLKRVSGSKKGHGPSLCHGVLTNKWNVRNNFSTRNLWTYWRFLYKGK